MCSRDERVCAYCHREEPDTVVILAGGQATYQSDLPQKDQTVRACRREQCIRQASILEFLFMKGKLLEKKKTFRTILADDVIHSIEGTHVFHLGATTAMRSKVLFLQNLLVYYEEKCTDLYDNYIAPRAMCFRTRYPTLVLPIHNLHLAYGSNYKMFAHGCADLELVRPYRTERESIWEMYKLFVIHAANFMPTVFPQHYVEAYGNSHEEFFDDVPMHSSFLNVFLCAYISYYALWNPFRMTPSIPVRYFDAIEPQTVKDMLPHVRQIRAMRTHAGFMNTLFKRSYGCEVEESEMVSQDQIDKLTTTETEENNRCYWVAHVFQCQK